MNRLRHLVFAVTLALACAPATLGGQAPSEEEERLPAEVLPDAQGSVDAAKQELADRLGVDLESIEVISVEPTDWPDTSLGCPEPGRVYAQVITPGYRIVLAQSSELYVYHGSGSRAVYCSPSAPSDGGEPTRP